MRRLVAVVLGLVAAAALPAAPVPVVKKDQWVLMVNRQLYLFTAGEDKPTKLTDGPAEYDEPAWSPDGKRIAYCARRGGCDQISVMDADGKNRTQLTHGEKEHAAPSWAPDGQSLAFCSQRGKGNTYHIGTIDAKDGSGLAVLSTANDYSPAFSPDGKTVAFVACREGKYLLYTMAADGKGAARLVDQPMPGVTSPAWSPDGTRIAATLSTEEGYEVHLVKPEGVGLTALTKSGKGKKAGCPSWSPDGKRLSFVLDDSSEKGKTRSALWVMDADGGNQKELLRLDTTDSISSPNAQWRPR